MTGDRVVIDGFATLAIPIEGTVALTVVLDGMAGTYMQVMPDSIETYKGDFIVDPDFVGRTLQTKEKFMRDNVTVNPIQVERVTNTSGGKTVYIGGII